MGTVTAGEVLLWLLVAVVVLVVLAVAGTLRSNSRYRATKPPAPPRVVAADIYQQLPLHTWVARAQHDAVAAATCPLTHLPVSPDPRRKES